MNARNPFVVLLPVLALSGCAVFSAPDAPDFVQLRLDGATAEIARAEATGRALVVSVPRAAPGYATTQFAYFQRDRELRYFGRHEWVAEPTRMLSPAVVGALDRSGRFAAVIAQPSSANADLRLDLELLALYQDFRGGRGGSELVLSVRAQLIDLADRSVIATRVFDLREPAATNPVAGAAAADLALARLLEQLAAFCVDAS